MQVELSDIDASSAFECRELTQLNRNAFLLCTSGSVRLSLDNKEYRLAAGDLFLYPAFSQFAVISFEQEFKGVLGAADFEHVLKALEAAGQTARLTQIRLNPQISLSKEQFRRIMRMVEIIRLRREETTEFSTRIVHALIQVLLFELMDIYLSATPKADATMERSDVVFMRFLSVLSQHFRREREVAFYAGELNLTPRYFATIIRNKSGLSPVGWIARFVIAEAKALLERPDISIKEVAATLNFPNQSFFGRYFKQHAGMAPGEYRRSIR